MACAIGNSLPRMTVKVATPDSRDYPYLSSPKPPDSRDYP